MKTIELIKAAYALYNEDNRTDEDILMDSIINLCESVLAFKSGIRADKEKVIRIEQFNNPSLSRSLYYTMVRNSV